MVEKKQNSKKTSEFPLDLECKKNHNTPLKHLFELAENHINKAEHILLVTDSRPDGDTFGSSLAFREYLDAENKKVTHFASSPPTNTLKFLPGIEKIETSKRVTRDETIDLVIIFDTSRTELIDEHLPELKNKATVIVFDHHTSDSQIGDINVIDKNMSSTCELVREYLLDRRIPITTDMAKCLLTGLMTDTGILTNAGTNSDSVHIAGSLLQAGGSIKEIVNNVTNSASINQLQLWGVILGRLTRTKDNKLAVTYVTRRDLEETETTDEDYFEIMDYMSSILDAEVIMFMKQLPNKHDVKISLRSHGRDVLPLAEKFGGGGHKKACGFKPTR